MIRRPPRSTPFPTRRSSDLPPHSCGHVGCSTVCSHMRHAPRLVIRSVVAVLLAVATVELEIGRDTSELQSQSNLVCRLLLEKKKKKKNKKKNNQKSKISTRT